MDRPGLMDLVAEQVVVFDGATGTSLQQLGLTEADFDGAEGCNEVLVRTRPDVVQDLHESFFKVGCHVVETDTFGATSLVLAEYGLAGQAFELNRQAAALAREAALGHSTADLPRYVAGSMGPTTKLPSLGHIRFDDLLSAYREQAAGLLLGGADLLLVETCQDLLQARAALLAARREMQRLGRRVPLMVSLTLESTGTMLLGTELTAALAALLPLGPQILGLNCATGPLEMKQHVQVLSRHSPLPIAVQPNAGMPDNVGGRPVYPLTPDELARWHVSFVTEDGARIVGGCCGTTPAHLAEVVRRVRGLRPAGRQVELEPALSSLYHAVPLSQEPRPLMVGERTNANGSRRFCRLLLAEDIEGMVELARDQERGGAHALDLCVAYVGRDEVRDMTEVASRLARQVRLPLFIDSTQPEVMEAALKLCGGRCVLNSVNLEEGETRARRILDLAAEHGAAVVALVIDEQGMARTVERKLEVAGRIVRLAEESGLTSQDLLLDMLTFTVASQDPSLRDAAMQTLEAISRVKACFPGVWTILGVSNISFGLQARARHVLNSVFLALAVERGLDAAIVEASRILPLGRIDETTRGLAEDLLLGRPAAAGQDPLQAYMQHFTTGRGEQAAPGAEEVDDRPLEARIRRKIVDGDRSELELLLLAALTRHEPLALINDVLIPVMREVGDLFVAGQMQLPFVLQSAEVMKHAVSFVQPFLGRERGQEVRGTLVLATVKGDVHDIGKNLVEILLSNNGYRVLNLGIKVTVEEMIRALEQQKADALGMSGLLVKSTLVMRDNLQELRRRGLHPPVLLGGAALTRRYVEQELRQIYGDHVYYGKDAFDALDLMDRVVKGALPAKEPASSSAGQPATADREVAGSHDQVRALVRAPEGIGPAQLPRAPFSGSRLLELDPGEVLSLVNDAALVRSRWQYRRGHMAREAYQELMEREVSPLLGRLKAEVLEGELLQARAAYGYFPCHAEGNELVVLDSPGQAELARLRFPRQRTPPHHCIADLFRPAGQGPDVLGAFVVTVGEAVSRRIAELFSQHRYRDYLHLHGLAVEAAEAAAELVHGLMRQELGLAGSRDAGSQARPQQQGARYSPGYPSFPDLAQQHVLFDLLQPGRIGVALTETAQMVPEHSVSAIVAHHPAARQFAV